MRQKVILDVDTGTDDAIAIMTAVLSHELDVLGICTVNGNRGIEYTTENTLRVVEYLGSDIPVYKGCAMPIVSTLLPWRRPGVPYKGPEDPEDNVHGDYLTLPESSGVVQKQHAVSWLVDTLMASDGDIILIPVGPLTNIAMALRLEPAIAEKIQSIYIMGGGYHEVNITPSAEFNFWIEPEAAKIVLNSGCDITIVPLDATHAAGVSSKAENLLRQSGTKAAVAAAEIISQRRRAYSSWQPMEDSDTVPVHDALAVCAVLNESVLENVHSTYVDIDISGGAADGQSICDIDKRYKRMSPNARIALSANREIFENMLLNILGDQA